MIPPIRAHDNSAFLRSEAKVKVACPDCGLVVPQHSLGRHLVACPGAPREAPASLRNRHDTCACGRRKSALGRACFRCGWRDPVFDALDAAIGHSPVSKILANPVNTATFANEQSEVEL